MLVVVVRHGTAGDRANWDGEDRLRPLDARGERQAAALLMGNDRQVLEAMEGMAQHHRFGGRLEAPRPVPDPRAGQIKP